MQHNRINGKVKIAQTCWKEVFNQIIAYFKINLSANNIIIAGDINQDIESLEVQQFHIELRASDVHHAFNRIEFSEMNNTYITRSKPIDSIMVSLNIMDCIEGCELLEADKIIITNHCSCIIDINFERYFNSQLSS